MERSDNALMRSEIVKRMLIHATKTELIRAIPITKGNDMSTKKASSNLLQEAEAVIYGDREATYGAPGKNLRAIADYWTVHLKHKYSFGWQITTDDVCQMMISVKQARLLNSPTHHDSQVDTAGYIALMERVQEL